MALVIEQVEDGTFLATSPAEYYSPVRINDFYAPHLLAILQIF